MVILVPDVESTMGYAGSVDVKRSEVVMNDQIVWLLVEVEEELSSVRQ